MPWTLPSAPSPPGSAPWPRGTAARPPRGAPSCLALHRGCGTPRACRASGRWPRGRPGPLCASLLWRRTAGHQRSALRTRRPSARRPRLPPPRAREPAAATPLHPPPASAASSPACDTP
eukprot:scaffold22051_cov51-Phaeocystis_antarctica.AAC.1